jgi:hypothetical protein
MASDFDYGTALDATNGDHSARSQSDLDDFHLSPMVKQIIENQAGGPADPELMAIIQGKPAPDPDAGEWDDFAASEDEAERHAHDAPEYPQLHHASTSGEVVMTMSRLAQEGWTRQSFSDSEYAGNPDYEALRHLLPSDERHLQEGIE